MTEPHLDLDALADELADPGLGTAHLASCAGCAGRLDELAAAQAPVQAALAGLAAPALPEDVAARLDTALGSDSPGSPGEITTLPGEITTLPVPWARPGLPRWLAAAAAVAVVLGGVGTALTVQRDRETATAGAADAGGQAAVVRNETGTDYTDRAALAAAVADLIAGTASPAAFSAESRALPAPAAAAAPAPGGTAPEVATKDSAGTAGGGPAAAAPADPLATVRTDAGLADCLRAVLPPDDPSLRPLALDYGSYRGTPALVVVLPGASRESLDVFVVGADCRADNDALLFYASVPAP